MIETAEKININTVNSISTPYYDTKLVQERFKLPRRRNYFSPNPFSFLQESILLGFYCLRDRRFRQISNILFKLLKKISKKDPLIPEHIKDTFLELDSTFIKIGQFLSSRSDLLPEEYIKVLSELQDSLPPIPFAEVKLIVENELKKPIEKIFTSFDQEPIASASIGQVHRAELINGLQVVVKVQRLDLSSLFYQDLAIVRCLALYLERNSSFAKGREWVEIVDEIGRTLFEEIDFIQEGKNADHFRKNLKSEEKIYIPKIFWQYTTKRLITIEFVPGIKITDTDLLKQNNHNSKEIAKLLVHAYFKQFFEDGFYHADPHPGNIVIRDDGTMVFYDFGMVGRVNESVRNELANVLISIVGNDTDNLIQTLKNLNLLQPGVNTIPLKRVIEEAAYKYYDGAKLNSIDLSNLQDDIKKLMDDKPMRLPSKFTYALRMTGTLDGVCRTLDPNFSLIDVAKPYLQIWLTGRMSGSAKWDYFTEGLFNNLSSIFPAQNKLLEKIKIYLAVIKDLPRYVSENKNKPDASVIENKLNPKTTINTELQQENNYLKDELKYTNLKLNLAYSNLFLLCFVSFGIYMLYSNNTIISILGFILLSFSLLTAIGVVCWSIFVKKVIQ